MRQIALDEEAHSSALAFRRLACALGLGALLLVPTSASADEPPRISAPVNATEGDPVPTRTYTSPFVAVDPGDPMRVVAAFADLRTRVCGLMRSLDGGQSWERLDALPSPAEYPFCTHTSGGVTLTPLAFGRSGTLYYGLGGWDTSDGGARGNMSVLLAQSDDLGESWETTVVRDARGLEDTNVENNRPVSGVAVDSTSGSEDIVYVSWRGNYPGMQPQVASRPMVAVSTDGGATFGEPIDAAQSYFDDNPDVIDEFLESRPTTVPPTTAAPTPTTAAGGQASPPRAEPDARGNFGGGNPQIVVARDGTLYVLWAQATANLTPRPPVPLYISRSTDRGETFETFEVSGASSFYGGPVMQWSAVGGELGTLHVVYEDKLDQTQGDRDIYHRRSTDGGETWTNATILNDDDPSLLIGQFIPNLSVAPNGRIDVAWWDFRDDPGLYVNDVYYTYSSDNGVTWSPNIRLTDRSIDRTIGPWSNNFDMRQPPGLASTDAFLVTAWDDTRNGDEIGQAQDIYVGAAQFERIGGGTSNAAKYALAAVLGLLAVGVVLLVVGLLVRRRPGLPPPTVEMIPDREPAGVG